MAKREVNLGALQDDTNPGLGFIIEGSDSGGLSGYSVATGDVNGDNIKDIIIGGYLAASSAGETYVIYGKDKKDGLYNNIDLSSLDREVGFVIQGIASGDWSGWAVAVGDVNGDEFADIIIGAPLADAVIGIGSNHGKTYVIYGKSGTRDDVDLSLLEDATGSNNNQDLGFVIQGTTNNGITGYSVAVADINGDDIGDIIMGTMSLGKTYVIYGQSSTLDNLRIDQIIPGIGLIITGAVSDYSGRSVTGGDVNGDGIKDIIIGAYVATSNAGETYVIYGKASNDLNIALTDLDLNDDCSAVNQKCSLGFKVNGINSGDGSGKSIAVGDVNGDGFGDIIIGAPVATSSLGQTYIVYGQSGTNRANVNLAALESNADTDVGFIIDGSDPGGLSGISVTSGDVNNDGIADIVIGAYGGDIVPGTDTNEGKTYIIYGKTGTDQANIDLAADLQDDADSEIGFIITGIDSGDLSGYSIAVGDVANDGFAAIIIGAYNAEKDGGNNEGQTYIIYGGGIIIIDEESDTDTACNMYFEFLNDLIKSKKYIFHPSILQAGGSLESLGQNTVVRDELLSLEETDLSVTEWRALSDIIHASDIGCMAGVKLDGVTSKTIAQTIGTNPLETHAKTSLIDAINELGDIQSISLDGSTTKSTLVDVIGTGELTTPNKDNIIDAINSLYLRSSNIKNGEQFKGCTNHVQDITIDVPTDTSVEEVYNTIAKCIKFAKMTNNPGYVRTGETECTDLTTEGDAFVTCIATLLTVDDYS